MIVRVYFSNIPPTSEMNSGIDEDGHRFFEFDLVTKVEAVDQKEEDEEEE